jgi:hypothetical protein
LVSSAREDSFSFCGTTLFFDEEGIGVALPANGGGEAVAGMHGGIVGKSEEFGDERIHDFFHGAAPEVGAAYAASEQRVTREKDRRSNSNSPGVRRKKETGTARRVAGSVNHLRSKIAPLQRVAFAKELVNLSDWRRFDAQEARLHLHRLIERNVVAMHQNGSAGVIVELLQTADVVNVRVGADDGFYGELVAAEQIHDAVDFVAGVEDDGFTRDGIADDGAVALQDADRNGEMQQSLAVLRSVLRAVFPIVSIGHAVSIALGGL